MSATESPESEQKHAQATYDLMAWNDDQRAALELHLHGAEIVFGWSDDGYLVVAEAVSSQVEEMIDLVEANPALDEPSA